jgi:hypothetical protein
MWGGGSIGSTVILNLISVLANLISLGLVYEVAGKAWNLRSLLGYSAIL